MHKLLMLFILLSPPIWGQLIPPIGNQSSSSTRSQPSFDFEKWFGSLPNKESSKLSLKNVIDMGVFTNDMGESMITYKEDVFGGNFIFRYDEVQLADILTIYDNGKIRSTVENVYLIEVSKEMNITMAIKIDPSILVKDIANFSQETKGDALLRIEIILIKGQYTTYTSDATKDIINSLPILD